MGETPAKAGTTNHVKHAHGEDDMPAAPRLNLGDYIREISDFPKPGILFRDITPLLACPVAFRQAIREMAESFRTEKVDLVAAAEARGFILAAPLALELNAGLVPIRKPGKLPGKTLSHTYDLEYGTDTLQVHADAIPPGSRVLMVDDLLATGGTIAACCRMIEQAGGQVAGCVFLIELAEFVGRKRIEKYRTVSLIRYP
jgi:adenine phosphoribosyltransferase